MTPPQHKSQRQEQIDINFKCDTTSELHSATSCGCRSACEPILNMDGTITTCSSTGETANHFRLQDSRNNRNTSSVNDQTNTAFTHDDNTFDRAFRNHGMNQSVSRHIWMGRLKV